MIENLMSKKSVDIDINKEAKIKLNRIYFLYTCIYKIDLFVLKYKDMMISYKFYLILFVKIFFYL